MSVLHHDDGLAPTPTDPHPWVERPHPTVLHLADGADEKVGEEINEKVDSLAAIKGIAMSIALSLPFWAAVAVVIVKLRS
jgi:hypothetical protein